jgi:hypothetical protein
MSFPVVRDEQTAERAAELALLSAVVHGGGPDAAEIGKAALFWAREDERAPLYADLVFASVNQAAWVVLEGLTSVITPKPAKDRHLKTGQRAGDAGQFFLYAWISPADKSARWVR